MVAWKSYFYSRLVACIKSVNGCCLCRIDQTATDRGLVTSPSSVAKRGMVSDVTNFLIGLELNQINAGNGYHCRGL